MTTEVANPVVPQVTSTSDRKPRGKPAAGAANGMKKPFIPAKKSNDHVYEAKRAEFEKKINAVEAEFKVLKPKLALLNEEIRNLTSNDSNSAAREELRGKIAALKGEKDKIRAQKEPIHLKLVATQEALKAKVDDLHTSKDKIQYKKPEDIDRKIAQLEEQIESGALKLIDEKKMVAEISKLRKARRELDSFSGQEASIGDLKKAADQFRAVLAEKDRELRTFDEQLKVVSAELTKLSSTRSANQGKIKALIQDRDALRKQMDTLFEGKNAAYEEFQKAQAAHRIWMQAEQVKWEETNITRDIERAIRDLEFEMKKLEIPACSDQIEQCLNIQNYLRINVLKESVSTGAAESTTGSASNAAFRQVEKLDDAQVLKKEEVVDNYSIVSSKGKGKKTTKEAAAPSATQSVKLPFWIISALNELKVNMVTNVDEAKQAIAALDKVKASFEEKQNAKMANIDSERASITARIEKEKARLATVPQEAAARMKANEAKRAAAKEAAKAAEAAEAAAATSSQ